MVARYSTVMNFQNCGILLRLKYKYIISGRCKRMNSLFSNFLGTNPVYHEACVAKLNEDIPKRHWHATAETITMLRGSKLYLTEFMAKLMKHVKFGKAEWIILQQTKAKEQVTYILYLIEFLVSVGDKDLVSKLMKHDGFKILIQKYEAAWEPQTKKAIIGILLPSIHHIGDISTIKDILPLIPLVVKTMQTEEWMRGDSGLVYSTTCLINSAVTIARFDDKLSKDLLDCKVVLAMVCVLKEVPRLGQEARVETWKSVISTLNLIPSTVMRHNEMITVAPGLLAALDSSKEFVSSTYLVDGSLKVFGFLVNTNTRKLRETLMKNNFLPIFVNLAKTMHNNIGKGDFYEDLFITLVALITTVSRNTPAVKSMFSVLMPLIPLVTKYMINQPDHGHFASYGSLLFAHIFVHGTTKTVSDLLKQDVVEALFKVFEANDDCDAGYDIYDTLFTMVTHVDLAHLEPYFTQDLLDHYRLVLVTRHLKWEALQFEYCAMLYLTPYVAVALNHFYEDSAVSHFVESIIPLYIKIGQFCVRSDVKRLQQDLRPGIPRFLITSMMEIKICRPLALLITWFVARYGSGSQISEAASAIKTKLNGDCCQDQSKLVKDEASLVLQYAMKHIKAMIEDHKSYSVPELKQILEFLVDLSLYHEDNDDEVLYWLEDLVSPFLGLLQERDERVVIKMAKEYINNLHH